VIVREVACCDVCSDRKCSVGYSGVTSEAMLLSCSYMGVEWHDSSYVCMHETNVSGTRVASVVSVARAYAVCSGQ